MLVPQRVARAVGRNRRGAPQRINHLVLTRDEGIIHA